MDPQVQKLTAKGRATRQRIIDGAAAEIREHGVAVATLDDILARTETSKSQLFHYFPDGKEQLLLAVATHEAQQVLDDQQPYLGRVDVVGGVATLARRGGGPLPAAGPALPAVGADVRDRAHARPGAQAVTSALMRQWHDEIAAGVRHMQSDGKVVGRTRRRPGRRRPARRYPGWRRHHAGHR